MLKSVLLVFCLLQGIGAFLEKLTPEWDGLKVTWDLNPFNRQAFKDIPRTEPEAKRAGYNIISYCDDEAKFRGARWVKDDDYSVVPIYDVWGFIAGIQTIIPNNLPDGYPKEAIRNSPFVADGDNLTLTAYFINPEEICSPGRSAGKFEDQGTGTDLYLQTSEFPAKSTKISKIQAELDKTVWTEGKCLFTKGKHFWYGLDDPDMSCDELYPMFLLYNHGRLNAFGWIMLTDIDSKRYEHPKPESFKKLMKQRPYCLYDQPSVSTMHVFLTSSASTNFC